MVTSNRLLKMVNNVPIPSSISMLINTKLNLNRFVNKLTIGALGMPSINAKKNELIAPVDKKNGALLK